VLTVVGVGVGGKLGAVEVHDAADTIVQQVTVQPGGFTGWHSHPGPAIVVHSARNVGSSVVRVYVTYFDVPATVTNPFIPAENPGVCPF
jgi:hypothetical protein